MDLLILGGTSFVGRHIAEAAIARGHKLGLFQRGRTGAGLFPDHEHLIGDRLGDVSALSGRRWDAVIDACASAAGRDPDLAWIPEEVLLAQGVVPYSDLPLWLPRTSAGFARASVDRAVGAGLAHRSLGETARAVLEWDAARDPGMPLRNGLSPEREARLLARHRGGAAPGPPEC